VVGLAQIGELQAMAGQVAGLRSSIQGLGDPSRLAGDPGALRDLAGSHRDVAGELRSAADQGRGQATALTGGAWQGAASGAFSDFWSTMDGQVRDLASRHAQMATSLDETAGRAESLNGQVADMVRSVESWLGAATAVIATLDAGAVPGLVAAASAILSRWQGLLPELEAFASGLGQRMEIDLGVSLPSPSPWPVDGTPPPGISRPGLPGILITTPGPPGPGILITTPGPRLPNILITTPGPGAPSPLVTTPGPKLPNVLITTPGPQGPIIVHDKPTEPGIPDPGEIPPGSTPQDVIDKLPPDIAAGGEPSRKGGGVRYPDPNRPGDQLIIEPGDPNASDPLHQGPYVKISKGGTVTRVPLAGNPSL
jgi:uncharacterized protein YukE